MVQESCSRGFQGRVCASVSTFSRLKINGNVKTGFGTEMVMSFIGDGLGGKGPVLSSSHSAPSSDLPRFGRRWNVLKFRGVWYF